MLSIAYRAEDAPYGVIVSVDGAGEVTLHFPADETGDTTLQQYGNIRLPHAFELDNAPDFERFYFVTADAPLSPRAVLAAVPTAAFDPSWTIVEVPLVRE